MHKTIGTTAVLASLGVLVLGGCATTGVGAIPSNGGNAPSASPSFTTEPEQEYTGPRDTRKLPQAL